MKKIILSVGVLMGTLAYSQVGVNTSDPKATLDVTAKATDGSKAEGLIAPRLTGDALKAAETAGVYGTAQNGAIVYATAAATTPGTGQVENVTAAGYYYFNATANKWVTLEANDWHLTGNKGTTAGTNFLGTTDNVDLVFKRNNIQAGLLNNAAKNTAYGVYALSGTAVATAGEYPTSAGYNVALGYSALASNTTGAGNIAIGSGAGKLQTNADFNVAIGHGAMENNTLGYANTAIGWWALRSLDGNGVLTGPTAIGGGNTALGAFALANSVTGKDNTAIGSSALQVNKGKGNVAVGSAAYTNSTSGDYNIAIGAYNQAGDGTATPGGSRNILIGTGTEFDATQTVIMRLPDLNGSNQMNIGNAIFGKDMTGTNYNDPAGKIGINTYNPGASLEVNGITTNTSGLKFTKLTSATPATSGAASLGVDASGNVVIASTTSTIALNVTTEKTSSYVASATDDIILVNPTSAGQTITLPTTGILVGKKYYISNKSATQSMTLIPSPRETGIVSAQAAQAVTVMYIGGSGNGSYSVISGF